MKTTLLRSLVPLFLGCAADFSAVAQSPASQTPVSTSSFQVVEQDENHKKWSHLVSATAPSGENIQREESFVELGTGLAYKDNSGAWHDSVEQIVPGVDGAVANQLPWQVIFSGDGSASNAVDVLLPGGVRLVSRVSALAYVDASGRSAIIAGVTNSQGEISSAQNEVVYSGIFAGIGSAVYRVKKAGLEQFVRLEKAPPPPSFYGLDNATAQLECWTAFFEWTEPTVEATNVLATGQIDTPLVFGSNMRMGSGRAFITPGAEMLAPVSKTWLHFTDPATGQTRAYLIEAVPYALAQAALATLPPAIVQASPPQMGRHPPPVLAQARPKRMQIASRKRPARGYAIDYSLLSTGSGLTLQSDTTYFVSSGVVLTTLTMEGAVVKFTNSAANPSITLSGTITCNTTPLTPCIFTAMDDNSVGLSLPFSSGSPSGGYANPALYLDGSSPNQISNIRVLYSNEAFYQAANCTYNDFQVVNCANVFNIGYSTVYANNGLICNATKYSYSTDAAIYAQHITVDGVTYVNSGTYNTLVFTNSVIANAANTSDSGTSTVTGQNNGFYNASTFGSGTVSSSGNPFQIAYCGQHYLSPTSGFLNAGVTNISASLVSDFQTRTVFAPTALSGLNTTSITLTPTVQRGESPPSLGWHYFACDWIGALTMTNATAMLTNSVVVAAGSGGTSAILLQDGSQLVSQGTPLAHNVITWYANIQEYPTNGLGSGYFLVNPANWGNSLPSVYCRFTDFPGINNSGYSFYNQASGYYTASATFQDCVFTAGKLYLGGSGTTQTNFIKNNLFQRVPFDAINYPLLTVQNNLFRYGAFVSACLGTNNFIATDNAFDNTAFTLSSSSWSNGWNGYYNTTGRLTPTNATDVWTNSFVYQTGPLSSFYQSRASPYLHTGSQSAANAGLYQYCVLTNEQKELDNTVSIGYHFVSVGNTNLSDNVWIEDSVPAGATQVGDGVGSWDWVGSNPSPFSGSYSAQSAIASGEHQFYFDGATTTLTAGADQNLVGYAFLDPANPPVEVMFQWYSGFSWEHRAYWGSDLDGGGTDGTASRLYQGPLPPLGQWVRLEVPASAVGLGGATLTGWAFTLYNGRGWFDHGGQGQLSLYSTSGSGIPDYLLDANGNGLVDSGEAAWRSATDPGLSVLITEPKPNSNLP